MSSVPRVLVTHPGRQHSHQNALALDQAGMLAGYWAGVPSAPEHLRTVKGRLLAPFVRYPSVPLPAERTRWLAHAPIIRRAADLVLPTGSLAPARRLAERLDLFACRSFDRRVARRLAEADANAVIACEISALATLREAARRGWTTLLDAPSFHHAAQDRLHGFTESLALHRRVVAIKNEEIERADHVLTVSELARGTYLEAGVAPEKVHAVPLGADLDLFTPDGPPGAGVAPPAAREVRFLFAGATIHRKGFDLLLAAFERVRRDVPAARLRVVGPAGDSAHLLGRLGDDAKGAVEVRGPVPQAELAAELRAADCLVLPSRNDSFGMVVAEALACGTPALVSEMVGAKDLIEEGVSGWVVPVEDSNALAGRMLRCARDPEALRAMAPAARRAAERATWNAYHRRFAALVRGLLPPGAAER